MLTSTTRNELLESVARFFRRIDESTLTKKQRKRFRTLCKQLEPYYPEEEETSDQRFNRLLEEAIENKGTVLWDGVCDNFNNNSEDDNYDEDIDDEDTIAKKYFRIYFNKYAKKTDQFIRRKFGHYIYYIGRKIEGEFDVGSPVPYLLTNKKRD